MQVLYIKSPEHGQISQTACKRLSSPLLYSLYRPPSPTLELTLPLPIMTSPPSPNPQFPPSLRPYHSILQSPISNPQSPISHVQERVRSSCVIIASAPWYVPSTQPTVPPPYLVSLSSPPSGIFPHPAKNQRNRSGTG